MLHTTALASSAALECIADQPRAARVSHDTKGNTHKDFAAPQLLSCCDPHDACLYRSHPTECTTLALMQHPTALYHPHTQLLPAPACPADDAGDDEGDGDGDGQVDEEQLMAGVGTGALRPRQGAEENYLDDMADGAGGG